MKKIKTRSKITKCAIICLLGIQMLATSSCTLFLIGATAGAAIAGTAWYMGSLSGIEKATPEAIKNATVKAFSKLKIKETSATSNALNAEVKGEASQGSVKVTAELKKDGQCNVSIRVGTFGDQKLSEQIYSAIRENLK
jgi:hypothetical protein